jgi:hypothetical protein
MLARLRLGPVVIFVNDVDSADAGASDDCFTDRSDGQRFLSNRKTSNVIAFRNDALDRNSFLEFCEVIRWSEQGRIDTENAKPFQGVRRRVLRTNQTMRHSSWLRVRLCDQVAAPRFTSHLKEGVVFIRLDRHLFAGAYAVSNRHNGRIPIPNPEKSVRQ